MAMARDGRADLVLLHGWGASPEVWRVLHARLADRFRLHAPALAFGRGEGHKASYIHDIADRVAAASPARCFVCGWSLGGAAAVAWALRCPGQVARLALVASSPCFIQREGWGSGLECEAVARLARDVRANALAALHRFIALQAQGDARAMHVARYLRHSVPDSEEADATRLTAGLMLLKETDLRGALARLSQPTLILHGDRDRIVPRSAAEFLAANIRASQLSVIGGAGHAPFASNPDAVCAELDAFFQ